MRAKVYVTLKKEIADPQGLAVKNALAAMGFTNVNKVRIGKILDLEVEGNGEGATVQALEEMCRSLLANTVMEEYSFEIMDDTR